MFLLPQNTNPWWRVLLWEFLWFGLKQAYACLFGGFLLLLVLLTRWHYPWPELLPRYDFLFLAALAFQVLLLLTRLETLREAWVIVLFHGVAMGMEVFKTSSQIASWSYPEPFVLGVGHVPLFAGFMYSAVGSYLARVWRIFDFRFSQFPPRPAVALLALLIYANFFTHHWIWDGRWLLLLASWLLFGRVWIGYRIDQVHRRMPLVLGFFLVALFIWLAENLATYAHIWVYPSQSLHWHPVAWSKWLAWYLLMLISFVLVTWVHRPQPFEPDSPSRLRR